MKRLLSILITVILSTTCIASPLSVNAATNNFLDTHFAEYNYTELFKEIKEVGKTNKNGDKYIEYTDEEYGFTYTITRDSMADTLYFYADFTDKYGSVYFYYHYPDLYINVELADDSDSIITTTSFKVYTYDGNDVTFYVKNPSADAWTKEIQEKSNEYFREALSGWEDCLLENTSYDLLNIGFSGLCEHALSTYRSPATMNSDGYKIGYCYYCGYFEEADYASIGKISLSKTKYTYDGKTKKPAVTVKDSNGKVISSSHYTVKYQNGRKNVGKYSVTVKFESDIYEGSKTLYFTIVPKSTSISSVTKKSKGFTVKWKKQTSQTSGYQIQYSTDKNFKKNNKTVTVTKNKTTSKTIKKLKAKKKYYIRIRTYKTVNKTKYYSSWSKSKAITTNK